MLLRYKKLNLEDVLFEIFNKDFLGLLSVTFIRIKTTGTIHFSIHRNVGINHRVTS